MNAGFPSRTLHSNKMSSVHCYLPVVMIIVHTAHSLSWLSQPSRCWCWSRKMFQYELESLPTSTVGPKVNPHLLWCGAESGGRCPMAGTVPSAPYQNSCVNYMCTLLMIFKLEVEICLLDLTGPLWFDSIAALYIKAEMMIGWLKLDSGLDRILSVWGSVTFACLCGD